MYVNSTKRLWREATQGIDPAPSDPSPFALLVGLVVGLAMAAAWLVLDARTARADGPSATIEVLSHESRSVILRIHPSGGDNPHLMVRYRIVGTSPWLSSVANANSDTSFLVRDIATSHGTRVSIQVQGCTSTNTAFCEGSLLGPWHGSFRASVSFIGPPNITQWSISPLGDTTAPDEKRFRFNVTGVSTVQIHQTYTPPGGSAGPRTLWRQYTSSSSLVLSRDLQINFNDAGTYEFELTAIRTVADTSETFTRSGATYQFTLTEPPLPSRPQIRNLDIICSVGGTATALWQEPVGIDSTLTLDGYRVRWEGLPDAEFSGGIEETTTTNRTISNNDYDPGGTAAVRVRAIYTWSGDGDQYESTYSPRETCIIPRPGTPTNTPRTPATPTNTPRPGTPTNTPRASPTNTPRTPATPTNTPFPTTGPPITGTCIASRVDVQLVSRNAETVVLSWNQPPILNRSVLITWGARSARNRLHPFYYRNSWPATYVDNTITERHTVTFSGLEAGTEHTFTFRQRSFAAFTPIRECTLAITYSTEEMELVLSGPNLIYYERTSSASYSTRGSNLSLASLSYEYGYREDSWDGFATSIHMQGTHTYMGYEDTFQGRCGDPYSDVSRYSRHSISPVSRSVNVCNPQSGQTRIGIVVWEIRAKTSRQNQGFPVLTASQAVILQGSQTPSTSLPPTGTCVGTYFRMSWSTPSGGGGYDSQSLTYSITGLGTTTVTIGPRTTNTYMVTGVGAAVGTLISWRVSAAYLDAGDPGEDDSYVSFTIGTGSGNFQSCVAATPTPTLAIGAPNAPAEVYFSRCLVNQVRLRWDIEVRTDTHTPLRYEWQIATDPNFNNVVNALSGQSVVTATNILWTAWEITYTSGFSPGQTLYGRVRVVASTIGATGEFTSAWTVNNTSRANTPCMVPGTPPPTATGINTATRTYTPSPTGPVAINPPRNPRFDECSSTGYRMIWNRPLSASNQVLVRYEWEFYRDAGLTNRAARGQSTADISGSSSWWVRFVPTLVPGEQRYGRVRVVVTVQGIERESVWVSPASPCTVPGNTFTFTPVTTPTATFTPAPTMPCPGPSNLRFTTFQNSNQRIAWNGVDIDLPTVFISITPNPSFVGQRVRFIFRTENAASWDIYVNGGQLLSGEGRQLNSDVERTVDEDDVGTRVYRVVARNDLGEAEETITWVVQEEADTPTRTRTPSPTTPQLPTIELVGRTQARVNEGYSVTLVISGGPAGTWAVVRDDSAGSTTVDVGSGHVIQSYVHRPTEVGQVVWTAGVFPLGSTDDDSFIFVQHTVNVGAARLVVSIFPSEFRVPVGDSVSISYAVSGGTGTVTWELLSGTDVILNGTGDVSRSFPVSRSRPTTVRYRIRATSSSGEFHQQFTNVQWFDPAAGEDPAGKSCRPLSRLGLSYSPNGSVSASWLSPDPSVGEYRVDLWVNRHHVVGGTVGTNAVVLMHPLNEGDFVVFDVRALCKEGRSAPVMLQFTVPPRETPPASPAADHGLSAVDRLLTALHHGTPAHHLRTALHHGTPADQATTATAGAPGGATPRHPPPANPSCLPPPRLELSYSLEGGGAVSANWLSPGPVTEFRIDLWVNLRRVAVTTTATRAIILRHPLPDGAFVVLHVRALCKEGHGPPVMTHLVVGQDPENQPIIGQPRGPIPPDIAPGPRDDPRGYEYRYRVNFGSWSSIRFTTGTSANLGDVLSWGDSLQFQVRTVCDDSPVRIVSVWVTSSTRTLPTATFPPTPTSRFTPTNTATPTPHPPVVTGVVLNCRFDPTSSTVTVSWTYPAVTQWRGLALSGFQITGSDTLGNQYAHLAEGPDLPTAYEIVVQGFTTFNITLRVTARYGTPPGERYSPASAPATCTRPPPTNTPTATNTPTVTPTPDQPEPLADTPQLRCEDGLVIGTWDLDGTPRNHRGTMLTHFVVEWGIYNFTTTEFVRNDPVNLPVTDANDYEASANALAEPFNGIPGQRIVASIIISLSYATGSDPLVSDSKSVAFVCFLEGPALSPTATYTPTNTVTPSPTPTPQIIIDLLLEDGTLVPGHRMVIRGNEVTARVTFRFFHGENRFNILMERDDGAAVDQPACYGAGMRVVREFTASGSDVVQNGTILNTCPVGEYDVIVNQADNDTAGSRALASLPPPAVSAKASSQTRTVDLEFSSQDYDQFRYRFRGNGMTGPWSEPVGPRMPTTPVDNALGENVSVDVQGCVNSRNTCHFARQWGSADFGVAKDARQVDDPGEPPLYPRAASPVGADWIRFEWSHPDPVPPQDYFFEWSVRDPDGNRVAGDHFRDRTQPTAVDVFPLEPATVYEFCIRMFIHRTEVVSVPLFPQCIDAYTAPSTQQVYPPFIGTGFVSCTATAVTAAWIRPAIPTLQPASITLVRFDYVWGGARSGTGSVDAVVGQANYQVSTSIYQAGDAVHFTVTAIYQVGGVHYSSAPVTATGLCTVPAVDAATADLWLEVGGLRSDVGLTLEVNTQVSLLWRTTGADTTGLSRSEEPPPLGSSPVALSSLANNLTGLAQVSGTALTYIYTLTATSSGGDAVTDIIAVSWFTTDEPIWDRSARVDLIIKNVGAPTLTVICSSGALNASWTVSLPSGLTLAGFRYTVIFTEEVELEGEVGADITAVSVPGFGEVITFTLVALYTVGDHPEQLASPAAVASCGLPNPPTSLVLNCPPPETGQNSVATASWTAPVEVTGLLFLRYEYVWFFDDESSFRSGQLADRSTTTVSSNINDYQVGESPRFAVKAIYNDTRATPNREVESATLSGNTLCVALPMAPTLTVRCDGGAMNAEWVPDVPAGLVLTGFSYGVLFGGLTELEELTNTLGPTARTVSIPGSGEVLTFVILATYTVGTDGPAVESPRAQASCGLPNPPTGLQVQCLADSAGAGATAVATWRQPIPVTQITFTHYEWTWLLDDDTERSGNIESEATTTLSSTAGDYQQGETARFSLVVVFTDTSATPSVVVSTAPLTANGFCAPEVPAPVLTVRCTDSAMMVSWTISPPPGITLSGFNYTVIFDTDEEEDLSDTLPATARSLSVPGSGEVLTIVLSALYQVGDEVFESDRVTARCGIPHPLTGLMASCALDGDAATATVTWNQPTPVTGLVFRRYEYTWFFDFFGLSSRGGQITDVAMTTTASNDGEFEAGDRGVFLLAAVFLDTNATPSSEVSTAIVTVNIVCDEVVGTPTITPLPTPTITPVPTPTNTPPPTPSPTPILLPPVEDFLPECGPQGEGVRLTFTWTHTPEHIPGPPADPVYTRAYYVIEINIPGSPVTLTSVTNMANLDVATEETFVASVRIRAVYRDSEDPDYPSPEAGPWTLLVEVECMPGTPKPPKLPLIEPQPVYFNPTLPPVLWDNEPFSSQIESHHVVIVMSAPGGYVSINRVCAEQENLQRVNNGEVLFFLGCAPTSHDRQVEILAIWPKDGRTVLFQHWVEVRGR